LEVVNARVDEQAKRAADTVFAGAGHTASEVIRALYRHVAATGAVPDFVDDPGGTAAALGAARLAMLRAAVVRSNGDELDDDDALYRETERRHV
jgi:antitoxin component of RelBE/YafQ-DinJ toxin-antitoxin module